MHVVAIDVYTNQNYSSILEIHNIKYLPTHRHCLAVCAIDQLCAAVSYDKVTSTCKMSETPRVIDNSTDTEKTASAKQIHSNDTQIYEFSTLLARGKRSLFYAVWSMLSKRHNICYNFEIYSLKMIKARHFVEYNSKMCWKI